MSETTEAPNTEQSTAQQPNPPQPETEQGQQNGQTTSEGTFTQADVDRIIADRLKRERQATEAKLKERYNVTDLAEIDKLLADKRKADEAAMSEAEKLQAEIEKERQARAKLEDQIKTMKADSIAKERRAEMHKAVTASGGKNFDDLFVLIQAQYASDLETVFGDDATPDETQMKRFIQKLQSEKAAYFGSAGAGSPSASNGISPTSRDIAGELQQKMRENARRTF